MRKYAIIILLALCCISFAADDKQASRLAEWMENAEKAVKKGRLQEADSIAGLYCSLAGGENPSFDYTRMLAYRAEYAAHRGNNAKAIELGQRVIDLRSQKNFCEERHVANAMNALAVYYSRTGEYDKAVELCGNAVKIFQKAAYKKDPQYAVVMANMGVFLSQRGNPGDEIQATKMCESALDKMEKGTMEYVNTMNNLAVCYAKSNNMAKADVMSKAALKLGKKIYANNKYAYAVMLANYSSRLANMRANSQAAQYADEAMELFRSEGHSNTLAFAKLLVNRGVIYTVQEKYDNSISLLDEALPLLQTIVGTTHPDYIRCVSELSLVYRKKGDLEKAEEYSNLISRQVVTEGANNAKYAHALSKQADLQTAAGNYRQAMETQSAALKIFRVLGNKENLATALNKLADIYIHSGDYTAAADSAKSAVEALGKDAKGVLLADINNTVAMAYYYMAHPDTARTYSETAINLYREQGDTLSSIYAKALANLALYNFTCGDTVRATAMAEKSKGILAAVLGAEHPDNASLLYNMARYYNDVDSVKTQHYYHRALQLQMRTVRDNFSHLTSSEREMFWNMKSYIFKAAPAFVYTHHDNDSILTDAYNALLFTKGLLLNSEINFRNFLLNTGDSVLLAKYDRLEMLRHDIDAAYSLAPEERTAQVEEYTAEAAELEKQLVRGCKAFGDFMENLTGDFHEVADALKDDEMAVEFMNLDVKGMGDTYIALYLKKGWTSPKCRILFNTSDLEEIGVTNLSYSGARNTRDKIDALYRNGRLGQAVWGKLLPELDGVKTVYFAPAGQLYQLGVEYLPIDSGVTMSDRFLCHRLSSTKLIAGVKAKAAKAYTTAIFGGLVYDMNKEEIMEEHESFKDYVFEKADDFIADSVSIYDVAAIDFADTRAGDVVLGELPGTLVEAENIGKLLMQRDVPTNMFLQKQGTEEAFKSLDGRGLNLIHVATHGFSFAEGTAGGGNAFKFLLQENAGSNPLSRSGLLLSGASYALSGKKLPQGIEDGILTAREISLMDLSGAELVVLSACRTGAGEVKDDGVFGLQRGFKKAGAGTLIMSLWNVDDRATMMMMEEFYSALTSGLTKREAFNKAQASVRAQGFGNPCYWAAFVMLDDI